MINGYYHMNFSFEVDEKAKALEIKFKNKWEENTFEEYAEILKKFINIVDNEKYTLVLECSRFNIPIPQFKVVVRPFLQVYKNAGFKHVRLMTENPQYEFRRAVAIVNEKIGFDIEYCNNLHIRQRVAI